MCKELYQRWQGCSCWGFLGPETCSELFKSCLGPRGEVDKKVVQWNDGMCNECWDRLLQEAKEMAEAQAEEEEKLRAASVSSGGQSSRSGGRGR